MLNRYVLICALFMLVLVDFVAMPRGHAQWTNRYARLNDFRHHIYLEQHELPILAHGPVDPAPAPDGRTLAFAAQGWLWQMDLATAEATRLTSSAGVDSRPRWSPDGSHIAFVRDNGTDTSVVLLEINSGVERIINTPAIELDPEFSADGQTLFYTSGESGSLQLRRLDLESGTEETLTDLNQVVRNTRLVAGGSSIVYLHGSGPHRVLRERNFQKGGDNIVHAQTLTYHLTADAHPVERLIVYSAPFDGDYHLWTMDLDDPRVQHRLTDGSPYALTPAFSADGESIYYVEADADRQFRMMRIPTYGGTPETVAIKQWNYGEAIGKVRLSVTGTDAAAVTARVSITRSDGHPVAHSGDATYFDPQTGRHYFYVEGEATFDLPAGSYTVLAARGPLVTIAETEVLVRADTVDAFVLNLSPIWDPRAEGFISADHHVHLNGDGHHRATHDDALRLMAGEDLDYLAPMSWNRFERRIDRDILGQETVRGGVIHQAQEVRSDFHGHVGLLGVTTPFTPWFFGPNNPILGNPDLTNGDVIAFADKHDAFATYVHPLNDEGDPFARLEENLIPLELISDSVLADRIGIEVIAGWNGPFGNMHVWYRLLNLGRPVAAMSGTDAWVDFYRTPAIGTARTYLQTAGALSTPAVTKAAAEGRGFITTGPALVFDIDDWVRPGDTVTSGSHTWRAKLVSTTAIDTLEIVVNGTVVERLGGVAAGETKNFTGEVTLPAGGWIAARAYASEIQADAWPSMAARPFAHSSPIWIGSIGSADPSARSSAANDLIRAIDAAQFRAREAYGEVEMPRLHARFDAARTQLNEILK
jgi:TolB protein